MGTTVMRKEELIAMLETINIQLEKLEKSMETNMTRKQLQLQKEQEMRIVECEIKLNTLEMKISSAEEYEDDHPAASLKVKRGFQQETYVLPIRNKSTA